MLGRALSIFILPVLMAAWMLVSCGGGTGAAAVSASGPPEAFGGEILLGEPTDTSIKLKILAAGQGGTVVIAYGTASGRYVSQSASASMAASQPLTLTLDGLAPNTSYFYRLRLQTPSGQSETAEYRFRTARPPGSTFSFTLQADSHLDENSDLALYRRTLANVLQDAPDFHIDLGDTFMTEKHAEALSGTSPTATDAATVNRRYVYERGNFGLLTHSAPLFLVNGNHEGELGWLTNGSAQNLAVWATQARKQYFLNPEPGAFYKGDVQLEPFVGQRASWYAWHWGDALFVVLDPYWSSAAQSSKDGWNMTLGERQYRWLASTLASSKAIHKFVFVHNLVGGLDGQMRGGIEAAPYFEWGGKNQDGTDGFANRRPGWGLPVHALLVQNRVTAVFHGHDHLYAKQDLDGMVYQEVPQPSAVNNSSGANLARDYHYASGTILSSSGHLRVMVSPDGVTTQYVRAWLPKDETAQRRNAQVDDSWTVRR